MHVEVLVSASLCLVTLLSSKLRSQFERFRLHHVQIVNETFSFITKLVSNNAEASRIYRNTLISIISNVLYSCWAEGLVLSL